MNKILIIEDTDDVRHNIQEILELETFQTLVAENGEIGVKLAIKECPDLIISDILMPVMDGYQVLAALRNHPETAITPFIFLTAQSVHQDRRQGMELGANDYLTKPFTGDELLKAVRVQLERSARTMEHYFNRHQEYQNFSKKIQNLQTFNQTKDRIFESFTAELRQTVTKISVALTTVQSLPDGATRDRHLEILRAECQQEIKLLNEVEGLHKFLTPDNVSFLKQFNLFNGGGN
ncbi:response regulator transcription factor [Chamaesiphon minutus]|uniref:Response regulator with CheY-like receiver domain and winged-helix DNA-binding domain n=1 Tax=Chamaesiphon minutus (strain ATCC 27169 / PCC 6605) TaxID=1173020 RepID=K9UCI1_CHAP6|nr:response regulator [Chamaesiphon minutus]AFY92156.1 response regulator with CheY-like receiver domain and winged-helix DNA-binding domain [Chamaesiphon minutus PCC 6605]